MSNVYGAECAYKGKAKSGVERVMTMAKKATKKSKKSSKKAY